MASAAGSKFNMWAGAAACIHCCADLSGVHRSLSCTTCCGVPCTIRLHEVSHIIRGCQCAQGMQLCDPEVSFCSVSLLTPVLVQQSLCTLFATSAVSLELRTARCIVAVVHKSLIRWGALRSSGFACIHISIRNHHMELND